MARSQEITLANGDTTSLPGLLQLVFESLPSGLVVFDKDLNVLLTNQTAKDLFPNDTDLSVAISNLAVESKYENWEAELREVIASGRGRRFDLTVPATDKHPDLYLNLVLHPLRAHNTGETIGGLLVAEDVSSRISMERRLAMSERLAAVGKLAARVAHELNNPLDGILRYANLAIRRADHAEDPKIVEYLEKAKAGIVRMSEIITALLEFSRTTPGTFEQATINKIIEDAVAAMEGRAQEAGVTTTCRFHQTDMPVVRGSNIFQVFCNIVKNAIDAMPDGGTLNITSAIDGPDVVVVFEDTGIGLPDEAHNIFEPFFTTKDPGKGTGLGLAVCKELIEKYGGAITAQRRQPRGTTITVRIPTKNCLAKSSDRPTNRTRRPATESAPPGPPNDSDHENQPKERKSMTED